MELLSAIYKEYPEMLNSISYDGIINDTDTISQKLVASLDKAAFERTDDGKIKAVIKAADMTSSFKDIYNFVMNDSSLKGYFGFLINRAAVADPTIKDLLNADSISEKISLSDAEIILDINGGKLKNISIVCSAGVDEATAVFKIEQDRNEGSNTTISISAQEAEILALDIFESYADGKLDMGIKLNITENQNKVTYDLGTIQYKDKTDDNVEMKLNMLVSDTSVGNMSMNFDSLATMKVEGDSVVTLMPTMKIAFNMDGLDSSVIDIKMNQKMSPLPEGVQVPESVNLMTLSQEDMDNLTAEVQQKVYGLLMPFLGI